MKLRFESDNQMPLQHLLTHGFTQTWRLTIFDLQIIDKFLFALANIVE